MAKTKAPRANARVRPKLSDKAPANKEVKVAVNRTEETTMPAMEGDSSPKSSVKAGITITGPMVLVSRLWYLSIQDTEHETLHA